MRLVLRVSSLLEFYNQPYKPIFNFCFTTFMRILQYYMYIIYLNGSLGTWNETLYVVVTTILLTCGAEIRMTIDHNKTK